MADEALRATARQAQRTESAPNELRVGEWYWVTTEEHYRNAAGKYVTGPVRWLGCVVAIGTNHAELEGVGRGTRVHFDAWDATCEPAPDAPDHIDGKLRHYRDEVARLTGEVSELTARLGVAQRQRLDSGSADTQALAVRSGSEPIEEYKRSLVKAKDKTLPALFEQIEEANERLATWMTAPLIPLKARAEQLKPVILAIESRIFSVELYAGLCEKVVEIAGGGPAALGERVRLLQRRHYMDEECLAAYEAGGMEFGDLDAFDAWLARPANRDRILPFPRCAVAFRVRRHTKDRDLGNFHDFINVVLGRLEDADNRTFLYLRNGDRVCRLNTGIEFDERLFPDMERSALDTGDVYARYFVGVDEKSGLFSRGDVEAAIAAHLGNKGNPSASGKEAADLWAALDRGEIVRLGFYSYVKWTPASVFYDDVTRVVQSQIGAHNRIVTILQGLLDRSPVFHPHPPWQLWTPDGFAAAIELVYDDSRALVAGAKPDFEAYRRRLNATLKVGSVTVGQEDAWEEREAERENARQDRDWRIRNKSDYKRYRPPGDPGPGLLARVADVTKAGAGYRWTRRKRTGRKTFVPNPERPGWGRNRTVFDDTTERIVVPRARVLNVDAYTPGDFKQFYADPRTRAEYLQWAPLLLAAEDYHAGKLLVDRDVDQGTNAGPRRPGDRRKR